MTTKQLEAFFKLFIQAVDAVQEEYITTVYKEQYLVIDYLSYHVRRFIVNGDLNLTGERIFCYELYHQLRTLMDNSKVHFEDVFLQGELRKHQIPQLLKRFGLKRLSKNFIPDFLLHSPGRAYDHAFVIEVKNNRTITDDDIYADIDKIAEFISRYDYQRGIFLGVSKSMNDLVELIQSTSRVNTPLINSTKNKIYIVAKESFSENAQYKLLSEII